MCVCVCVVCVCVSLSLSLCVFVCVRTDSSSFDFTCLLHTYFRVPDISKTTISGLGGLKYVDKVCTVSVRFNTRVTYIGSLY